MIWSLLQVRLPGKNKLTSSSHFQEEAGGEGHGDTRGSGEAEGALDGAFLTRQKEKERPWDLRTEVGVAGRWVYGDATTNHVQRLRCLPLQMTPLCSQNL